MTSDDLIQRLGLQPLAGEGGFFVRTHTGPGDPPAWSSIYYLLTEGDDGYSSWHRLSVDEQWHFYAGDPVELYTAIDEPPRFSLCRMGNRIALGEVPQVTIPAGTIQGARLSSGGDWALLGMTVIPAYTDACRIPADLTRLQELFPEHRAVIRALAGGDL